jgi:beta-glucosidase
VLSAGSGATARGAISVTAETERLTTDVDVDERTLRELYLVPFEWAVTDAGAWLVAEGLTKTFGAVR